MYCLLDNWRSTMVSIQEIFIHILFSICCQQHQKFCTDVDLLNWRYIKKQSSTLKTTKKLKVYKTLKAGFQKLNKIFYGSSIDWRTRKPGGSSCFIDKLCFIRIRCIKFIMGEKNRRLPWAIKISLPTVCLSLQVFFLFLKDLALCLNT